MPDTFPCPGLTVSGTGTSIGKTVVSRALTCALRGAALRLAALKPLETGCDPDPLDARALAGAARRPELADAPGLYRARPALAPHAATLAGAQPPAPLPRLVQVCRDLARGSDFAIIEGAGGLLVPIHPDAHFADFARLLGLPVLLVAPDALGVLSHALTACESADARQLAIAAIVLVQPPDAHPEPGPASNSALLAHHQRAPVLRFPHIDDPQDEAALARAAQQSGLLELALQHRANPPQR